LSNAKPVPLARRLKRYLALDREVDGYVDRESDLTPAQRRRAWHKALRSGERTGDGRELLGCKGRPTPRRPRRG
jgi:hypothetical protein